MHVDAVIQSNYNVDSNTKSELHENLIKTFDLL